MQEEILYKNRCRELSELLEKRPIKSVTDFAIFNNYNFFKDLMGEEVFKEILKSKERRKKKRKRCNDKLQQILCYQEDLNYMGIKTRLVFGTCTFNDKELQYKERTRAKKIDKWLKKHFVISLVNIDYGKKNEREHYHFLGLTTEKLVKAMTKDGKQAKSKTGRLQHNLKKQDYTLGFEPNLEVVKHNTDDYYLKKVSNYLVKINNHYTKETTRNRRTRLII